MYKVTSEIYQETDFESTVVENGRIISKFTFVYPSTKSESGPSIDKDSDLILSRKKKGVIEIEHSNSTALELVGLQVWRGALYLADFLFHIRNEIADKHILEIGAGVGLTSIATAIYCKNVICTDIDTGGILDLIRANVHRNRNLLTGDLMVIEFDFKKVLSEALAKAVNETDIVIAADVIYDDNLTEALVSVFDKLLDGNAGKRRTIYMALEKRFVFTIVDLDTGAPCYEHFKRLIKGKSWTITEIKMEFPQYFDYERCKELTLLKITN